MAGLSAVGAGLARAFDGYRVVQISDVHADGWMTPERLSDAIRRVNGERPDLVVFTGDLVTADALSDVLASESAPRPVGPLREVRARDGAVAVLGNHDHWADAELVGRVLGHGGFRDVGNRHFSVRRGGDVLHFAGVDDVMEGRDRLRTVLGGLPVEGAAVLLAHVPDFADRSAESGRFGLQISGHSHGGQVSLPGVGPPVLPPLGEKYPAGRYEVGDGPVHEPGFRCNTAPAQVRLPAGDHGVHLAGRDGLEGPFFGRLAG